MLLARRRAPLFMMRKLAANNGSGRACVQIIRKAETLQVYALDQCAIWGDKAERFGECGGYSRSNRIYNSSTRGAL